MHQWAHLITLKIIKKHLHFHSHRQIITNVTQKYDTQTDPPKFSLIFGETLDTTEHVHFGLFDS